MRPPADLPVPMAESPEPRLPERDDSLSPWPPDPADCVAWRCYATHGIVTSVGKANVCLGRGQRQSPLPVQPGGLTPDDFHLPIEQIPRPVQTKGSGWRFYPADDRPL
jgi:hypothetical protein